MGGYEILEHLSSASSDTLTTYNILILIISPILWASFTLYKKIKFREQMNYVQRLKQLVVGGRTNTIKQIVILGRFLLATPYFVIQFWMFLKIKSEENGSEYPVNSALMGNILIGTLMTFAILLPFLESRALRFVFNHMCKRDLLKKYDKRNIGSIEHIET